MKQIQRRRAELIIEPNGEFKSNRLGTYSDDVTMSLAQKFAGKIVTVRDIARVQFGRVSYHSEQRVRRSISRAVNMFLRDGILAIPVYEETGRHKVVGVKVISEYNAEDMSAVEAYANMAKSRGDISAEKYDFLKQQIEKLRPSELE